MCGRFTLRTPLQLVLKIFGLEMHDSLTWKSRYNLAPTQEVLAIRQAKEGPLEPVKFRWGLIPSWAKDTKLGASMINARSETISEKPAFRTAFKRRRCLVAADGYFEWQTTGKAKQPYYIHMADERPFAFAGLWESWSGPKEEPLSEPMETCTLITTSANATTAPVHDRMPVILPREVWDRWLDPEFEGKEQLLALLKPYEGDDLTLRPVSTLVNNPRNDKPEAIEAIKPEGESMLF